VESTSQQIHTTPISKYRPKHNSLSTICIRVHPD
jgi:hypothetical protein